MSSTEPDAAEAEPGEPAAGEGEPGGVSAALSALPGLHERPPAEHVAVYEDISARLQHALGVPESSEPRPEAGDP